MIQSVNNKLTTTTSFMLPIKNNVSLITSSTTNINLKKLSQQTLTVKSASFCETFYNLNLNKSNLCENNFLLNNQSTELVLNNCNNSEQNLIFYNENQQSFKKNKFYRHKIRCKSNESQTNNNENEFFNNILTLKRWKSDSIIKNSKFESFKNFQVDLLNESDKTESKQSSNSKLTPYIVLFDETDYNQNQNIIKNDENSSDVFYIDNEFPFIDESANSSLSYNSFNLQTSFINNKTKQKFKPNIKNFDALTLFNNSYQNFDENNRQFDDLKIDGIGITNINVSPSAKLNEATIFINKMNMISNGIDCNNLKIDSNGWLTLKSDSENDAINDYYFCSENCSKISDLNAEVSSNETIISDNLILNSNNICKKDSFSQLKYKVIFFKCFKLI